MAEGSYTKINTSFNKTKLFNTMKIDDKYEVEKSFDSFDLLCDGA